MPPIYIGSRTVIARYIGARPVQAVMYRGEDLLGGATVPGEPLPYPSAGLIYYLNANDRSDSNIVHVDNHVSSIGDKSPANSGYAVQSVVANQPATNIRTLRGGNALGFESGDKLELPSSLLDKIASGDCTMYATYSVDVTGPQHRILAFTNGAAVSINLSQAGAYTETAFGGVKVRINAAQTTGPRVIGMRREGATLTGFAESLRGTATGCVDQTLTFGAIGGEYSALYPLVGQIRELMIYEVAHTDAQIADVIAYLSREETLMATLPINVYPPVLYGGNNIGDEYFISDGYWRYAPTSFVKTLKRNGITVSQPFCKTAGDSGTLTAEVIATNSDGPVSASSNSLNAAAPYTPSALVRRNGTNRSQAAGLTNQLAANHTAGGVFVRGEFRIKVTTGRYPVKNPSFIFPNWGVLGGDVIGPNEISIDAGIEDSRSVAFTPLTFSGGSTKTVLPGVNEGSDNLPLTLEPFSEFFIRVGVQVPNATSSFWDGVAGGADAVGVFSTRTQSASQINGIGDLVKSAGESSLNYYRYGPLEITGELPVGAISVGGFGDSIGAGGFLRAGVEAATAGRLPFSDYCRPGEFMQYFSESSLNYRANCTQYHTHNIFQFGANDLTASFGLSTFQDRYRAGWAKLKAQGQHVAQCTIFPRHSSPTDTTPYHANWLPGGIRDQLNTWFLTCVGTEIDAVIDASALVEKSGDKNSYNPAYTNDGTHLSPAGTARAAIAVKAWADALA